VRSQPVVAAIGRRDQMLVAGCILILAAAAWTYLVHLDRQMTASMQTDAAMARMAKAIDAPWRASDVVFALAMWGVMMVGMMGPAAAPVFLLFAGMQARRADRRARLVTLLFGFGYFTVWFGFSAGAALAQWALHDLALSSSTMIASSPRLGGAILIAAGAYQLTPAKRTCLTHCQSPLGFLVSNWRDGARGAFRMGLRHGAFCLGCCWALMGVLFAVGVMNLAWVAALSAFILLEKTNGRAAGMAVARIGGLAMITSGILVAAR
jgi:predicted metal-binding membrane protein